MNPVAVLADKLAGVLSVTESLSPPVACTTGGVPYRWLNIWFTPHGS